MPDTSKHGGATDVPATRVTLTRWVASVHKGAHESIVDRLISGGPISAALSEKRSCHGCRQRPRKQESLSLRTTEPNELVHLLFVFYTLRNHLRAEGSRQGHDALDNGRLTVTAGQACHKRSIDFERIDGEPVQIAQ